ncbi:MAG: nitrous oxide reductase accessory protein NosL [Saprospiraceae bacterium]|nr:MAG: nitrous-oxide reductase accessory protein NosL [Bacteroidetes bacterium OLB9]MCO6463230.1 nitrous oxide reductase accessory protein NosL [Saprospiraceae bacterium]MCZ2338344.1 nitrous oxide reductase accessory protein NosL [Chitinophagales bacterium]
MKISNLSKYLMFGAALALILSLFFPLWSIYLDAPQYPEGLRMQIWANNLTGDVEIINGLNHYIGMKTLHVEDFPEFTILPYLLGAFAVFFLIGGWIGKRGWLNAAFFLFLIFGIIAMVDFWHWEYQYGHDLDPNAAIQVPGMSYQPPLIGFKQLLNFGAFSIPATGGWLFIGAGLMLLIGVLKEAGYLDRFKKTSAKVTIMTMGIFFLTSCTPEGPDPINLHQDSCEFCKMSISAGNFAAEVITEKGRIYKFDDLSCMMHYADENDQTPIKSFWVGNYMQENSLIDATKAWYVKAAELRSPMAGNTAAFLTQESAQKVASEFGAKVIGWNDLQAESTIDMNDDEDLE